MKTAVLFSPVEELTGSNPKVFAVYMSQGLKILATPLALHNITRCNGIYRHIPFLPKELAKMLKNDIGQIKKK